MFSDISSLICFRTITEKEEIHTKEQPRKNSQEELPSKEDAETQQKDNKSKQNPAETPRKSANLNSMANALASIDPANIDEREVDEDSSEKINRPKKVRFCYQFHQC